MLRDLTAADTQKLAAFFAENNRPEIVQNFHPFPLNTTSAQRICNAAGKDRYFARFEAGGILGFAMLRGWDEGFTIPSFGILVHHAHHGKGIGRELTAHAISIAGKMNASRIRLTVNVDNTNAVRLYEKTGFHPAEKLADGRLVMFAEVP